MTAINVGSLADHPDTLNRHLGRMSLRFILMSGVILLALVPAVVLGVGSTLGVRSLVFADAASRDMLIARVFAAQIDQFLAVQRQSVDVVAREAATETVFDAQNLQPMLSAVMSGSPAIASLLLTDARGVSFVRGTTSSSPNAPEAGIDYSGRAYWKEVVATRRPVIAKDIIIGRVVKVPLVAIAAPIIDASGQLRGVAIAGVSVDTITKLAAEIRFGTTGSAWIATSMGQLFASGNEKDFGSDMSQKPIWSEMAKRNTGELLSFIGSEGESRLGGFATVPGVGWKVWVTRAMADIEHDIVAAYGTTLWLVGMTLAAIVLLAALFARLISRPVEALEATASALAGGELSRQAPEWGPRELQRVACSLNSMSAALRRMLDNERNANTRLERAVADYGMVATKVAGGDLTARAPKDEVAEFEQLSAGLNRMVEALAHLISEIQEAASNTTAAASEILAATSQQVAATTEEATAVKQTTVTVTQVRQTAELGMKKAKAVADSAEKIARIVQDGERAVGDSIKSSEEAKERMEGIAERILVLSEQAHAIAEINATVNDLAEQSNLLAVNASIEAAKAGDSGKGFAVVAAEVRAMAEQSKQATAQVRGIVGEIQRATQAAVLAAEQGVKTAEAGVLTGRRSGEAIRAIAANVTEAGQAAQQILAASQQQTVGMDQVMLAMHNIEESSTQTVAATRQVESAARSLNDLARRLIQLVSGFSATR
jgi:methyl-accepting chemotaxis protein